MQSPGPYWQNTPSTIPWTSPITPTSCHSPTLTCDRPSILPLPVPAPIASRPSAALLPVLAPLKRNESREQGEGRKSLIYNGLELLGAPSLGDRGVVKTR
ncbi:MAG: hypothetical protein EBE86_024405 [Hormoscilla sp. GUM202]|nr:hypothetical protein [Hormoscilla sp. GUM202]